MPLTLPSHAAAILPFTRLRWLPPAALVAGAAAPDLGYLLKLPGSHTWEGLFLAVLPAGLLLWLWAEWLLLPLLREVLPTVGGLRPTRLLATRGASLRPGSLAPGALGVACGAATHLLWDGFTHDGMWPASQLYPSVTLGLPFGLTVARALQHFSSLVGAVLVLAYWLRAAREPAAVGADPGIPGDRRRSGPAVVLALGVLAVAALQCARELRWTSPETPPSLLLWMGFWAACRGGLAALTAAGALAWWRRRQRPVPSARLDEPPHAA